MFVVILFVVSVSVCLCVYTCVRECAYGAYGGAHIHTDACPTLGMYIWYVWYSLFIVQH